MVKGIFTGINSDIYGNPILNVPVIHLNMTYQNLRTYFTLYGLQTTTYGTASTTVDASGTYPYISMTINFVMQDDSTMKTVKLENYRERLTDYGSYGQFNIYSGRVYNFDFGYIDVSTPTPILANTSGVYQGVLRLDGANGSWAEVNFGITCDIPNSIYNGSFYDGNNPPGEFCCSLAR